MFGCLHGNFLWCIFLHQPCYSRTLMESVLKDTNIFRCRTHSEFVFLSLTNSIYLRVRANRSEPRAYGFPTFMDILMLQWLIFRSSSDIAEKVQLLETEIDLIMLNFAENVIGVNIQRCWAKPLEKMMQSSACTTNNLILKKLNLQRITYEVIVIRTLLSSIFILKTLDEIERVVVDLHSQVCRAKSLWPQSRIHCLVWGA